MTERTYEGRLVDDKDGFEAVQSDVFYAIKLTMGRRGEEFTIDTSEAEAFAKWILKISPYGYKRIA